ncbi:MAG: hypothetical protein HY808_05325 [Nitrospirae bacterium]|nr:hypothetical protein [Nitrospirota bacterium]
MKKFKGIHCKPNLPLSNILKKWVSLNTKIANIWKHRKDVPWWYNERADISIFAGAAWLSHGLVFEEFVDEKTKKPGGAQKAKRKFKGRVDLYLSIDGQDFIIEAKQCWSGASSVNVDVANRIQKVMERACEDIRKSHPHGQRRLAFVFVVPDIKVAYGKTMDQRILAWIDRIKRIDCDAMAWIFPVESRNWTYARVICTAGDLNC